VCLSEHVFISGLRIYEGVSACVRESKRVFIHKHAHLRGDEHCVWER
jgi:hypothetical protein